MRDRDSVSYALKKQPKFSLIYHPISPFLSVVLLGRAERLQK